MKTFEDRPPKHYHPGALLLLGAGVSLSRVARILNVHPSTVSRWAAGISEPRPDFLPTVRALAGTDVARKLARLVKSS